MTREEVIERLKLILETDIMTLNGFNIPHEPLEKEIEALKIAIKALEQEPILDKIRAEIKALSPEPTCYDVVDGNPIKDAIWETLIEVDKIFDKYKAETEEI